MFRVDRILRMYMFTSACQDIALVSLQLLLCCDSLTLSRAHCHTYPSFLSSCRVNTEGEASPRS